MEEFIDKHEIDVGKTFAILILSGMVSAIYEDLGDLLLAGNINLNLGIILMFFLGRGMYRHNNTARKWMIGLTIAASFLMLAIAIASLFWSGITLTMGDKRITDPPAWKVIAFLALASPLLWASLTSLYSKKAKEEFEVGEPVVSDNSDQSLRD